MRILQLFKDWTPLLVVVGILLLMTDDPSMQRGRSALPAHLLEIGWFALGLIMGSWMFRAYYKGGQKHRDERAMTRHNDAVVRARAYLSANDPDRARFVTSPFIKAPEITELHLLYAQALVAGNKASACRDYLVERLEGLQQLPLERLKLWDPVFTLAGATDQFVQMLSQRFAATPDSYIAYRISDHNITNGDFDLLLEWGSPWLSSGNLPEPILDQIRLSVLRAMTEIVGANLRLDLVENGIQLLEEYREYFRAESIWYKLYAQALARQESIEESIEISLTGYRLTSDPSLLLDAFSALVLSTEPVSALAHFVEGSERFPEDGMYAYFVGWVLQHTGLSEEARPHFYRALAIPGPHRFFTYLSLSHLLHRSNDVRTALELLHHGTGWNDHFPFLWECKSCGEIGNEPVTTCSKCQAWNQQTIVAMPAPDPQEA